MSKCSGITQAGTACRGTPIDGSQWCYAHHPDHAQERRRHGSKGGKRGGRGRPHAELQEVKGLIRHLVAGVLKGERDRADAAVCGQLLNVQLRAIATELQVKEQTELIERLEELEALEEARKQREGRRYGA
jgi:hypothetical protein